MSMIIGKALIAGGGTAKRLEFEYTGTYNERLDDGVVELLTSGVLKVTKDTYIDAFLVGGGASGGSGVHVSSYSGSDAPGGPGGSSGFTKTIVNALLQKGVEYQVIVGAGGAAVKSPSVTLRGNGEPGGSTIAFGYTVQGGSATSGYSAGSGGSGGGSGGGSTAGSSATLKPGGDGGSDGQDGESGRSTGGKGQGSTTREFGEATGKLYAGGGGGGRGYYSYSSSSAGLGGDGGGGNGGSSDAQHGVDGQSNTGSGGGGGGTNINSNNTISGAGGSGIVCIRLHKDDPIDNVLSGTWKFNDTLTMPSSLFTENFNYDGTFDYAGSSFYAVMGVKALSAGNDLCFGHNTGDLSSNYIQVYRFTDNTWLQATAKTIKFWNRYQVVSPEFYAWFTANATKISD